MEKHKFTSVIKIFGIIFLFFGLFIFVSCSNENRNEIDYNLNENLKNMSFTDPFESEIDCTSAGGYYDTCPSICPPNAEVCAQVCGPPICVFN